MTFTVCVDDNFRHQDDSERYEMGEYRTFEAAVMVCKKIVDDYLVATHREGMSASELYDSYLNFGEDPFVVPMPEGAVFSSWEYARRRCAEICSAT